MDKTKTRNKTVKKSEKQKPELKKYFLKKIDSLSWEMGEKKYSGRQELYDR